MVNRDIETHQYHAKPVEPYLAFYRVPETRVELACREAVDFESTVYAIPPLRLV